MNREQVLERVRAELEQAERARSQNNEGRARVCARRAAGWAAGFRLSTQAGAPRHGDALKLLRQYRDLEGAPEDLRAAAARLTARVTPEHRLPHDHDPIDDARRIVRILLESPADIVSGGSTERPRLDRDRNRD